MHILKHAPMNLVPCHLQIYLNLLQEKVRVFDSPEPLAHLTRSDVRLQTTHNYAPIIFFPLSYPLGNELNYLGNMRASL